jgi:serine protease AprX
MKSVSTENPVSMILYLRQQHNFLADRLFNSLHPTQHRQRIGLHVLQTLNSQAKSTQPPVISYLRQKVQGITRIQPYYVANIIVVDVTSQHILNELVNLPQVEHVEPNNVFKASLGKRADVAALKEFENLYYTQGVTWDNLVDQKQDFSSQSVVSEPKAEWNVQFVKANKVWEQYSVRGEGLVFANADTGVMFTHEALLPNYAGNRVKHGKSFIDHNYAWFDGVKTNAARTLGPCGINSQVPCDDTGHGTHTTATAVGSKGVGIAPKSKWIACKNMDQNFGQPEFYIACLQFFLAPHDLKGRNPKPELRPIAIGNSYGCPPEEGCSMNTFTKISQNLRAAGIFMAVAAGNSGPNCKTVRDPPGTERDVISVGALAFNSTKIAYFSSKGPVDALRKPDVVAPGSAVRSAYNTGNSSYATLSGVSFVYTN